MKKCKVRCRHCRKKLGSYVRRGLCFGCYHAVPSIRHQYPSPSKYGRRGDQPAHDETSEIVDVRKTVRPCGTASLRIVRRDGYAVVKCYPAGHLDRNLFRTTLAHEEETDGMLYASEAEAEKAAKEMMKHRSGDAEEADAQ